MELTNFKYNQKKLNNMAMIFLLLGIAGLGFAYYKWFVDTSSYVVSMGKYGSIFIAILGFGAFTYMKLFGKKADEIALSIGTNGITSNTTPIAKAAELIEWDDLVDINFHGNYLDIHVKDPKKYADRMNNFFVRDTYLKGMKGVIRISIAEVDGSPEEMSAAIGKYLNL
ncbi:MULTISPECIES: STM3941 family protein [Sphingobacterium]|uniref:STM3941 family protein n=1 Tax=Sphingobacterium TaxID=28453 RepID=UPI00162873E4|nr:MULTISPECIES: STM3941 family protein [Sphingobacterium]MBV2225407.1 hypothetical protein [Sphingobacterium mizutaii]